MAMNRIDLLEIAKGLDPRFAENMPEEVAKAFSEGRVTHVFRTSEALTNIQNSILEGNEAIPLGGLNLDDVHRGSIYVRTDTGATARWKLPELSMGGDDAGWNANRGYGAFMPEGANPVLGEQAVEGMSLPDGKTLRHPGHNVVDIYSAQGTRSYLQFDPSTSSLSSVSENISPKAATSVSESVGKNVGQLFSDPRLGEASSLIEDIIEKSGFNDREFKFSDSSKPVTGSDILKHVQGVEYVDNDMGSVAAYDIDSKKMTINTRLLDELTPEEIATTIFHELGHAGSDLSGTGLSSEVIKKPWKSRTAEELFSIGAEEARADIFSREVLTSAGVKPGISLYGTSLENLTEVISDRNTNLDKKSASELVEEILIKEGVDPNIRPGLSGYMGYQGNPFLLGTKQLEALGREEAYKNLELGYNTQLETFTFDQPPPPRARPVKPRVQDLGTSRAETVRTGPRRPTKTTSAQPVSPVGSEVAPTVTPTPAARAQVNTGVNQANNAVARSVAKSERTVARGTAPNVAQKLSKAVAGKNKNLGAFALGAITTLGTYSLYKKNKENKNRAMAQQNAYYHDSAAKIKSIGY